MLIDFNQPYRGLRGSRVAVSLHCYKLPVDCTVFEAEPIYGYVTYEDKPETRLHLTIVGSV